jgi:HK97 family phage prohead protease
MMIRVIPNPEPIKTPESIFGSRKIVIVREKRMADAPTASPARGTASFPVESKKSNGGFDVVKDSDGNIVDYQNVRFIGYLSTFDNVTPADRDGDRVLKGAFTATLRDFLKNPVLLADHTANTSKLCGRITRAFEDNSGLFVEGEISNGQSDFLKHIRALVAEGALRAMSMGGVFYYQNDGRSIEKVDLLEATLCPLPCNPDCIVNVIE